MTHLNHINYRSENGKKQVIDVVYQDEHILAVNKPPELLVIPDRWQSDLPNLRDLLNRELKKDSSSFERSIWVVHRIDAGTSGIVLCALNLESHRKLNLAFEQAQLEKTYLAVVQGIPSPPNGRIDLPLSEWRKGGVKIDYSGKPAITDYRVVEKFRHHSLMKVFPKTGRTHQIRVHLQALGNPLAIDPIYGKIKQLTIHDLKRKAQVKPVDVQPALISRLTLHAFKLKFVHPISGINIQLEAKQSKDFNALLKALRKWDPA